MANKIIAIVIASIAAYLWFYVGYSGYYAEAGSVSPGYIFVTALTIALMRS